MSNKLVKRQKPGERLTVRQRKVLFRFSFWALVAAFIAVWMNIAITSSAFKKQMENMILGEDYYVEEVVITGKRAEDAAPDNNISKNYFFYYHNGKVFDYSKRMQVPGSVYTEYDVGETIAAYTADHASYSYYKEGVLGTEYTNNEMMKAIGVVLGVGICAIALVGLMERMHG